MVICTGYFNIGIYALLDKTHFAINDLSLMHRLWIKQQKRKTNPPQKLEMTLTLHFRPKLTKTIPFYIQNDTSLETDEVVCQKNGKNRI